MFSWSDKVVLVTGGAGAIGSNLCKRLLKEHCKRIIVIDDLSSGFKTLLPNDDRIEFVLGSILDDEVLHRIFRNSIDIVFHLAANFANEKSIDFPQRDLLVNGLGTLKILTYCRDNKTEKIVYASSSSVYGKKEGFLQEDMLEVSVDTPYKITKLLGEYYMRYFYQQYGLQTVILRYFNSFGPGEFPGEYRNVIPNFIQRALLKLPLIITGDGSDTRDFNFIDNTVQGTILAAESTKSVGRIYNVASGREISILDLARLINRRTDNSSEIIFQERRRWDSTHRRVANISRAKKELGYLPIDDFEEHIQQTIQWVKKNSSYS